MEGDWKEKGWDACYKNHPLAASQVAMHNRITRKLVSLSLLLRGSAESLGVVGKLGRKKRKRAGPFSFHRPPRAFYFSINAIFIGIPETHKGLKRVTRVQCS